MIYIIQRLYRFTVSLMLAKHLMSNLIIWIIHFVSDDKKTFCSLEKYIDILRIKVWAANV